HTLGNGLTCCQRELGQMLAPSVAQGRGMVHAVLPRDALWPCVSEVLAFLGTLVPLRRALLPPCVQLRQGENLGLIGLEAPVVRPRQPLLPLAQWRLVRFQASEAGLWGCRPRLMPLGAHPRLVEHGLEGVPEPQIQPSRPPELGGAR